MRSSSQRTWLHLVAAAIVASLAGPSQPALAELTFEVVKGFELPESSPSALVVGGDGALYGTTYVGGRSGLGTVFRIDEGGHFARLHSFTGGEDGRYPQAPLVQGVDGAMYGTTQNGGLNDYGTVFRIDNAGNFTTLHSFNGSDGRYPSPVTLVVGLDGALYGTTLFGGSSASGDGTVFRIDNAGNLTTLHSFNGSDGRFPWRVALVVGTDGALYGTTGAGGSWSAGTVFRIDAAGNFSLLHSFHPGTEGRGSRALVVGNDGALYGVNEEGGPLNAGAIFRIDPAGAFATLYSFTVIRIPLGPNYWQTYLDGERPISLVLGSDGALYGTTSGGGPHYAGTIFRIDTAGNYRPLFAFRDPYSGHHVGAVIAGIDGALYGTAHDEVFRIDSAGTFSIIHTFGGAGADGVAPNMVVQNSDGALYGLTSFGGAAGLGTIFKIDAAGTFASLHSFSGAEDGQRPVADLVLGSDGALYGTTERGGPLDRGTTFRIDTAGNFTSLQSFSGTDGANPNAALVPGSDGALYGTTPSGGSAGYGTLFKMDGLGALTSLHSFEDTFGSLVGPVPGGDGTVYGSTSSSIFKIDDEGTFTLLHAFESFGIRSTSLVRGSDGGLYGIHSLIYCPGFGCSYSSTFFQVDGAENFTSLNSFDGIYGQSALVVGSDGAFYGTVYDTIFRIDRTGNLTTLHQEASSSLSTLVIGADGALYGTTRDGGPSGAGTVFRIDSAGNFTTLHSFTFTDGNNPSTLTLGRDGALYGTTSYGGPSGAGTVFRIDSAGAFTSLHAFEITDGYFPSAAPTLGGDCALYGAAPEGGPAGGGVAYRIFEAGHLCQRIQFDPLSDRTVGDPPLTLSATASSGLPVSFSASGRCKLSGDQVILKRGVGVCRVTASQAGDSRFEAAAPVTQEFRVWARRATRRPS